MTPERFTVTEQHMKLLAAMYVGWDDCEFGAPAIDCKRPYGNSSVYDDLGLILGLNPEDEEACRVMHKLHREMQTVLQILVCNAEEGIRPGVYVGSRWHLTSWTREEGGGG